MCIIVKKNFNKKIFDMFYGMVFWFYKVNWCFNEFVVDRLIISII